MFKKIFDYLRYPSTWKGLVGLLGVAGLQFAPDQADAIVTACVGVVSAIALFFSDADVKVKK